WDQVRLGAVSSRRASEPRLRDGQANLHHALDVPLGRPLEAATDQVVPAGQRERDAGRGHALRRGIVVDGLGVLRCSHGALLTGRATLPPQRTSMRSGGNATRGQK
ncbi:MAG: hypothetical protein ACK56I_23615, partial [bacterium]